MTKTRLQVFLSRNGICSRREAMAIVQSGAVVVNGKVVSEPSFAVDAEKDQVRYKGQVIGPKPSEYIMLYKPSGYITTKDDAFAKKKVTDLLPASMKHLNPVGRLDKETEGLLLFTNDGDLLHQLTHPKFDIGKEYYVRVKGDLDPVKKKELEEGIMLDGKKTSPAEIFKAQSDGKTTDFHMIIHEGWNRQIRRMCEEVGLPVRYLRRIQHGPIKIGDLQQGRWRRLSKEEVKLLKSIEK